ncbi:MAG: hypothetical protein ACK5NC_11565 [Vibrio sp.]
MGLATNIEKWDMSAAIGMATEGVRAKYNAGGGGGGFGAADMEIASKLDGGKVLAVLHQMGLKFHLVTRWAMFAYASPNWNRSGSCELLFDTAINDWVMESCCAGQIIQRSMYERMRVIVPLIAGGLALEQLSGADVSRCNGELVYHAVADRKTYIAALVEYDCEKKGVFSESFKKKRTRYYQSNWSRFSCHVDHLRTKFLSYDTLARKTYKKQLEKQMMSI